MQDRRLHFFIFLLSPLLDLIGHLCLLHYVRGLMSGLCQGINGLIHLTQCKAKTIVGDEVITERESLQGVFEKIKVFAVSVSDQADATIKKLKKKKVTSKALHAKIAVLDIEVMEMKGLVEVGCAKNSNLKVKVVSLKEQNAELEEAMRAGAHAYEEAIAAAKSQRVVEQGPLLQAFLYKIMRSNAFRNMLIYAMCP